MLTGTQLGVIVEAVGRGMCSEDHTCIDISLEKGRYAIHWSEEDNPDGYIMYVQELLPGVVDFSNGRRFGKWESTEIDFNTRTVRVYRHVRECRHKELETKLFKQFDEAHPPDVYYWFDEVLYALMTLQNYATFDTQLSAFEAAAEGVTISVRFNKNIESYFFSVKCPRCRNWMLRVCNHCKED